jgi:hypothetical protein
VHLQLDALGHCAFRQTHGGVARGQNPLNLAGGIGQARQGGVNAPDPGGADILFVVRIGVAAALRWRAGARGRPAVAETAITHKSALERGRLAHYKTRLRS